MSKTDARILKRGFRRLLAGLLTALMFALAMFGFYLVAISLGYLAVLLFCVSLAALGVAFLLLYALGIRPGSNPESKGDSK